MGAEHGMNERLKRMRPMLVTLAEALIAPSHRAAIEASDIVQQTLLEAAVDESLLRGQSEAALFCWLRQALKNNLLDAAKHLRTQKSDIRRKISVSALEDSFVQLESIFAIDETSPSQLFVRNELLEQMLTALQELPTNQRLALVLKHLRGQSLKQVAEELNLSEPAVAGLLHRGRQQLARRLQEGHR